jgi:hypothetical protein
MRSANRVGRQRRIHRSRLIRATVQLWSATDSSVVSDETLDEILAKFTELYSRGEAVGTQ